MSLMLMAILFLLLAISAALAAIMYAVCRVTVCLRIGTQPVRGAYRPPDYTQTAYYWRSRYCTVILQYGTLTDSSSWECTTFTSMFA